MLTLLSMIIYYTHILSSDLLQVAIARM